VDEAATNIIEHGYHGSGKGDLVITCETQEQGLQVTLHDHAPPFEPDDIPAPDTGVPLEELKSRGLGIYLMRKMMDEVHYHFDREHGNTLTMIKRKR
jgi:serine/threonine-protein kinase RsbW